MPSQQMRALSIRATVFILAGVVCSACNMHSSGGASSVTPEEAMNVFMIDGQTKCQWEQRLPTNSAAFFACRKAYAEAKFQQWTVAERNNSQNRAIQQLFSQQLAFQFRAAFPTPPPPQQHTYFIGNKMYVCNTTGHMTNCF